MPVYTGDFCCVPVHGDVGWLIKLGEKLNGDAFTQYDHAEIFISKAAAVPFGPEADCEAPYGFTFGAYPDGARLLPLLTSPEKLPGSLWSSGTISLTGEQRAAIVRQCALLQGTPYSWADYWALAAHRLHVPAPGLRKYVADSRHMICSQLVDYVYMQSGVHLFNDGRWPGYVTPADLAERIIVPMVYSYHDFWPTRRSHPPEEPRWA